MIPTAKMAAGATFPNLSWPAVGGGRVEPAAGDGWRLLIVYRGQHCPVCKTYLGTLNKLLDDFKAAGVTASVVSADTVGKAQAEAKAEGWRFPVGCDLSIPDMRALGLYVSGPRSPQETDRPFSEPGAFVINPEGKVQIVDISNAPVARPDLRVLLGGLKFIIEAKYPIRGGD